MSASDVPAAPWGSRPADRRPRQENSSSVDRKPTRCGHVGALFASALAARRRVLVGGRSSLQVRIAVAHISIALDSQYRGALLPRLSVFLQTSVLPAAPHGNPYDDEGSEQPKAVNKGHGLFYFAWQGCVDEARLRRMPEQGRRQSGSPLRTVLAGNGTVDRCRALVLWCRWRESNPRPSHCAAESASFVARSA